MIRVSGAELILFLQARVADGECFFSPRWSYRGDDDVDREATGYRVGSALTDDGILASDHRPVFADVRI